MKEQTIVFFFRAYNDIDHMTPIIYRLRKDLPSVQIKIVVVDVCSDYRDDFRVNFLRKLDLSIHHIIEYLDTPFSQKSAFYFRMNKLVSQLPRRSPKRIIINILYVKRMRQYFRKKLAKYSAIDLFKKVFGSSSGILVFDQTAWKNLLYRRLCNHAAKQNIVTVAVPHGHNTFSNEMIQAVNVDCTTPEMPYSRRSPFKYVVFENSVIAERYKRMAVVDDEQTKVIGSSRFCDEWMGKIHKILPIASLPELPPNTLKLVFFVANPKYNGIREEVNRSISLLAKFSDVHLILKPHTRGMRFQNTFGKNVQVVGNECHSPQLIEWADVVLFTMTSVIFHCLKLDKPALYLKNTHSNKLLSERYFKTWEVDCLDDLRDFIWKFKENRKTRTYSKKDRDLYCSEIIEPTGKDVLGDYVKFLGGLLANDSLSQATAEPQVKLSKDFQSPTLIKNTIMG